MPGPDDMILPTALGTALWLLLPAGAANMAPVLAAWLLPSWDAPVDFGCSLGGRPLLGSHKTWRGMAAGMAAGSLVFLLQQHLAGVVPALREILVDPGQGRLSPLFGAWLGLGALCGDLAKSLVKRRLAILPGTSWFPFDQLDWLFGTLVFAAPFLPLSGATVLAVLVAGLALHLVFHALGRVLGLNRSWI